MLNNANILVKDAPDEASQILEKLDNLLRYQLNDSTRREVFLTADIQFLTSFLELEKVRRDHFEYTIFQEEIWRISVFLRYCLSFCRECGET